MKALTRAALGVALAGLLIVAAPAPLAHADECSGLPGCVVEVPCGDLMRAPTPTPTAGAVEPDFMYECELVPEDKARRQALFWWLAGGAGFFGAISLGALFAWLELRKGQRLL